jgi:nitroimidazol reductase NimA-like FMN-containing flavoprotein (pyridoxamine 5'-phosphate oxidase superfamily)
MARRTRVAAQVLVGRDMKATAWAAARERLEKPEQDRTYWLATVRPDGRPHVVPLLGLWLDDAFYFLTGKTTRREENLSRNSRCVMTTSSTTLPALDLIVEGTCRKIGDNAMLDHVAEAYGAKMGWPLEVRDGGVFGPTPPTAGPPPYAVYELAPEKVIGLPGIAGTKEGVGSAGAFTPTRWRFGD